MPESRGQKIARRAFPLLALGLLAAGGILLFTFGDDVRQLRDELREMGAWGVALLIGVQVLWMLTTVPTIPLMSLAGLLYGPWRATLYLVIGGCIGATSTFWLGRTALQHRFERWVERYDSLRVILRSLEKHEVLAVLTMRLLPIFPISLMNYGFGATHVRFATYFVVSLLALIPGAALYAGLGQVLWATLERREILEKDVLALLIGSGLVLGSLTLYVRRQFAEEDARRSSK